MKKNGFKAAKHKVIRALRDGNFQHEADRNSVDVKNQLLTGAVFLRQKSAQSWKGRRAPTIKCPRTIMRRTLPFM